MLGSPIRSRVKTRHEHNPCRLNTGTETRSSDMSLLLQKEKTNSPGSQTAQTGQQIAWPFYPVKKPLPESSRWQELTPSVQSHIYLCLAVVYSTQYTLPQDNSEYDNLSAELTVSSPHISINYALDV